MHLSMSEKLVKQKSRRPSKKKVLRALEKRAPKLVENGKKALVLLGTKSTPVLNSVLTEIYHLKKGSAIKYTKRNKDIRPFESDGLEFFSMKTDCSLFVFGSHSKKGPNNLVLRRRSFDHHIYDLVEVGVENFKPMSSFSFDQKITPKVESKPFIVFSGEGLEIVEEQRHLKEVLLDLFREEVVENLNLAGVDLVFVCTAISSKTVLLRHCGLRLKWSGTVVPRMELVEVRPSMDLVVCRHRLPNKDIQKEAFKTALDKPKKKNVKGDLIVGKMAKMYMPDQQIGGLMPSTKVKGPKREWLDSKRRSNEGKKSDAKKHKVDAN